MSTDGSRVLVTGGGGFIGGHLTERLLELGHRVRVLDNFATGRRSNLEGVIDDVELVEGDIQSYERVHNAVRGCEVVFHQAALPSVPRSIQDPLTSTSVNVTGTLNVLLASRDEDVRRVVYASSSSVYGANPELPKRESMRTLPMAPYAVSKLAAEGFCRSFHSVYGLDTVALRYFNVFGPRQDPTSQYAAVIPNFINALLEGVAPVVHGDGTQSRDFTYVDTVARVIAAAVTGPVTSPDPVNLAFGSRTDLLGVVALLEEILGRPLEVEHVAPRTGDVKHSQADSSRLHALFPDVQPVELEEGLRATVAWFESLGADAWGPAPA